MSRPFEELGARIEAEWSDETRALYAALVRQIKADTWDEARAAKPQYLGPDHGHDYDCLGWDDCYCASYPNPYRDQA